MSQDRRIDYLRRHGIDLDTETFETLYTYEHDRLKCLLKRYKVKSTGITQKIQMVASIWVMKQDFTEDEVKEKLRAIKEMPPDLKPSSGKKRTRGTRSMRHTAAPSSEARSLLPVASGQQVAAAYHQGPVMANFVPYQAQMGVTTMCPSVDLSQQQVHDKQWANFAAWDADLTSSAPESQKTLAPPQEGPVVKPISDNGQELPDSEDRSSETIGILLERLESMRTPAPVSPAPAADPPQQGYWLYRGRRYAPATQ